MALKATRVPANYRVAFTKFIRAFRESPNYESFQHMASGLLLAQAAWTVSALTAVISRPDAKSRRAYNRFFTNATWEAERLAQALVEYLCARRRIEDGDEVLLHIDDTFARKFADATDGVGEFRNPTNGEIEEGNVLVTSCLQLGGVYVPYRPLLYLGEDDASALDEPFRTKLELAVERIVEPLQLPAGVAVTVVTDSAYYSKETIHCILAEGYDVVCRLKADKHVRPVDGVGSTRVDDYVTAHDLRFDEVTIEVREREKTYEIATDLVVVTGLEECVRLVVTEGDDGRRYTLSTDLDRSPIEILEIAEDRWNIETVHQQAAQKFGLKDYQLETKDGIERFLQLVCVVWTLVVLEEGDEEADLWQEGAQIGDRRASARRSFAIATLIEFSERVASPLPEAERRRIARAFVV